MSVNDVTANLPPYPMEELARIRQGLRERGKPVYDFGTGDPTIPTWEPIREAIAAAVPKISQYPTIKGTPELNRAIWTYMERRFGMKPSPDLAILPTGGSKEAVFHVALSLIGRCGGRRHLIYPDPGYPVYRSSALFAGGIPYPVRLERANDYLLEPWNLPEAVQRDAAALWINYPHNPTGAEASRDYLERVIAWAEERDVVLLSDDCYIDIYEPSVDEELARGGTDRRPLNPITLATKNVVSFMSLSKRSGMTGHRSGFMIGDRTLIEKFSLARSNMGVSTPAVIQAGATVAWQDEDHVAERRRIFSRRLAVAVGPLMELGLLDFVPRSTFYLWCRIPKKWGDDDVRFCLELAEEGVITSPSQWISEGIKGYMRFALVPDERDIADAMTIVKNFVQNGK